MRYRWHLASLFIIILLASVLAACGGGGNAPTGTTPGGSSASLPSTSGASPTFTSTVTFTLSGAEKGTYTVSEEEAYGASDDPSRLMLLLHDQSGKEFHMTLNGYQGPGSYTLVPGSTSVEDQLEISLSDQTSWNLASVVATLPAGSSPSQVTCSVAITSDTAVASAVIGRLHRLTGSFSCPKLAATPGFQQTAPVTVTNGQLDLYFQLLSR